MKDSVSIFWFRRDLRLEDNTALFHALMESENVLPIFIFDKNITDGLVHNDPRISFIYERLQLIDSTLKIYGSSLLVLHGNPVDQINKLIAKFDVKALYVNKDYEPYARNRDQLVKSILDTKGVEFKPYKDQVIFEEKEIVKKDGTPYTVFTPYKKQWLLKFQSLDIKLNSDLDFRSFYKFQEHFPYLQEFGFRSSLVQVKEFDFSQLKNYDLLRDIPSEDATSYLSPHLRFGTVSIRQIILLCEKVNAVFFK